MRLVVSVVTKKKISIKLNFWDYKLVYSDNDCLHHIIINCGKWKKSWNIEVLIVYEGKQKESFDSNITSSKEKLIVCTYEYKHFW